MFLRKRSFRRRFSKSFSEFKLDFVFETESTLTNIPDDLSKSFLKKHRQDKNKSKSRKEAKTLEISSHFDDTSVENEVISEKRFFIVNKNADDEEVSQRKKHDEINN